MRVAVTVLKMVNPLAGYSIIERTRCGQAFLDRKIKLLTAWMSVSHLAPMSLSWQKRIFLVRRPFTIQP